MRGRGGGASDKGAWGGAGGLLLLFSRERLGEAVVENLVHRGLEAHERIEPPHLPLLVALTHEGTRGGVVAHGILDAKLPPLFRLVLRATLPA